MFDPFVQYDAWGRPVYNRNSTPPDLNIPTNLAFNWGGAGGGTQTVQGGGGGGLLDTLGTVKNVASLGKDTYKMFSGDDLIDWGSFLGGASSLGPSSLAALNAGATGPGGLLAGGGATSLGAEAAGALSMPAGFAPAGLGVIGPSTAAAAASTATGPGGLLAGGGATSLAPASSGAASAGGMGALGYGAAGMGAMMALIALGGGFDPDTARIGLGDSIKINPDGTLSTPNWTDTSNYGAQAPDAYHGVVNDIYDTLNRQIASGKIDPSWLQPGSGLDIGFGSDADTGLDNPQAYIRFITGNYGPGNSGSQGEEAWGGDPIDIGWMGSYEDLLNQLQNDPLPLLSAAPTFESTPFGQAYMALRQPDNKGDSPPEWWAYRMLMNNAGSRE